MTHLPSPCSTCPSHPARPGPSRRQVVTGATAVAAFGVPTLAACSDDPGTSGRPGVNTVSVAAGDVPVGGGVIQEGWVVTQPTEGDFKAFSAECTHQGCAVSEVADGQIICSCHGSYFAIADGAPTAGPATKPLAGAAVEEADGQLTISPQQG
ncbi:ubiquinol-cytochrome c reductase iron-sulfur subunit [Kytococcus sedentarius]|uniref:ubiquinol-cytochrome c reductase iron-sulfur subunit n=1 Tax=Kytococcus sedentarius TaxID=1276 RepID=UPI0038791AA2